MHTGCTRRETKKMFVRDRGREGDRERERERERERKRERERERERERGRKGIKRREEKGKTE